MLRFVVYYILLRLFDRSDPSPSPHSQVLPFSIILFILKPKKTRQIHQSSFFLSSPPSTADVVRTNIGSPDHNTIS